MKATTPFPRSCRGWCEDAFAPIARVRDQHEALDAAPRALLVAAILVGVSARVLTIDRLALGIGVLIHCVSLATVFVLVSMPCGLAAGSGSVLLQSYLDGSAVCLIALWASLLACNVLPLGGGRVDSAWSGGERP